MKKNLFLALISIGCLTAGTGTIIDLNKSSINSVKQDLNLSQLDLSQIEINIEGHDLTKPYIDSINYTDPQGRKQGKWIKRGWQNAIVEIMHYRNDTLHGPWYGLDGMKKDGYYQNGKRHGLFRTYYGKMGGEKVLAIYYCEQGSLIWETFPAANNRHLIPGYGKGFRVHVDSVYAKVPFTNGKTWYEGLFVQKEYKGVHKVYYRDGRLKGMVDHDQKIITLPDSTEKKIIKYTGKEWDLRIENQSGDH